MGSEVQESVATLLLNWNGYDSTKECIQFLSSQEYSSDIYVIDNNSSDQSGRRIDKEFEDIGVVFNDENLGFGAGINAGVKQIGVDKYDYIWFLNNDLLFPEEQTLGSLVEKMQTNQNIGMVSPVIKKYPDTDEVWFKSGYIKWDSGMVGHESARKWYRHGRMPLSDESSTDVLNDYIPLCCALVRTETYCRVGGLPEQYFLYFEDVDFSTRVREEGYLLVTHEDTEVYHKVSQSSDSATRWYYNSRNRLLFIREFSGRVNLVRVSLSIIWSFVFALVYHLKNSHVSELTRMIRGYIDGILGRDGKYDDIWN